MEVHCLSPHHSRVRRRRGSMRRVPFTNWVVLRTEELEGLQASPRRIRRRLHQCAESPRVVREVLAADWALASTDALARLDYNHSLLRATQRGLRRFIEIAEGRSQ